MIFDPPTRSRRRTLGRLLWPLLIAGAVVTALVVSAAGDETRVELEYLEVLRAQVSEISRDGDALRDVVSRLDSIERVEFETVVNTIRDDVAEGLSFVAKEPPTAALVSVRSVYRQALQSWDVGLLGFSAAVLLSADEPTTVGEVDNMVKALAELRTGDAIYRDLVSELAREDTPDPLTPMPTVALMPGQGRLVTLAVIYVDAARSSSNSLGLRPGLAVSQILSDPDWEVNPSDQAVLPATETVSFSVVVTNLGNVASEPGSVTVVLSGGSEPIELEGSFGALDPNQQTTVMFAAMAVTPGGVYQVDAELVAAGGQDSDLTDNHLRVQFTVNG